MRLATKRALKGYLFILPWIIGFGVFVSMPFVRSFIISFQTVEKLMGFHMKWVGLANYKQAFFIDERFLPMLLGIVRDSLIEVPIILVFSLVMAFLVTRNIRGVGAFRAIFFLPVVVASGLVVEQLFGQGVGERTVSFMNIMDIAYYVFLYLGETAVTWFIELMNRITLVLWRSGVQILVFIAGLQGISPTLYEAARVDGASEWAMFWKITLPMLSPIILVNIIYSIVDSYTQVFNPMLDYIRERAFQGQFELGYAAAIGWLYFAVVFLFVAGVFFWSRRWVFEAGSPSE